MVNLQKVSLPKSLPEHRMSKRICGLYYKPITIINDDSSIVSKFEASLTDDARVVIYIRNIFIAQATGQSIFGKLTF
jgi:hypothetical protein